MGESTCPWLNPASLANQFIFFDICLNLIPAWKSNYMPSKVLDEVTYPFPNFNGYTIEVWEWTSNFIPHIIMVVLTPDGIKVKPC